MGIFIDMIISKSVTKEKWESVYEETLQLVSRLPLADRRKVEIHGIETMCMVHSGEIEERYGWNGEYTRLGWHTIGDMYTLRCAEDQFMPRTLLEDDQIETEITDVLMDLNPLCEENHQCNSNRESHTEFLWGGKTQGEPYHIYLLAVAALIEARLGIEAYTTGDITKGQFKRAVAIANKYLEEKIDLPDQCNMDRLFARINNLPVPETRKLKAFIGLYLGGKDAEFGDFLRDHFSEGVLEEYWSEVFKQYTIGTHGYADYLREYLWWGFDLKRLCDYPSYLDKEGNELYQDFINEVMNCKLYIADKDCSDPLRVDQETEDLYGVATQFAQFFLAAGKNKSVDRYIPLETIRKVLSDALGVHCDVNAIIDHYLDEEKKVHDLMKIKDRELTREETDKIMKQAGAEKFAETFGKRKQEFLEERQKYDITIPDDLIYFELGETTVSPDIRKMLVDFRRFHDEVWKNECDGCKDWDAKRRCKWLVDHNISYLIREEDWDNIFTQIEKEPDSFGRFYSVIRTKITSDAVYHLCLALMVNDEIHEYTTQLILEQP